jgi:hypothetical protein
MYIAVHEDRKTILVQIYLHSCPGDEKKMSNDPISICMLKMMEEYQKNNILYFNYHELLFGQIILQQK